jgi:hypothetical protein
MLNLSPYLHLIQACINVVYMPTYTTRFHLVNFIVASCVLTGVFCLSSWVQAEQKKDNPVEVGNVNWSRNFKSALLASKISGKSLFLLFQEVPGCIGCRNFGQNVLTHPLLVEAIEDEFIPILVYNNRQTGQDTELLNLFKEPSWNYQVIRFIDSNGQDVIPRRDKVWSIGGVATRMIEALQAIGRPAPLYLQAVALEHDNVNLETAVFAMSCFWTGEHKLGKIDGVIFTEAGWYDGREVTLIRYHKKKITLPLLVELAAKEQCAQALYVEKNTSFDESRFPVKDLDLNDYRTASRSDQKKHLQGWLRLHKNLNLIPMQMMKLNSLMPDNMDEALSWLSPRQSRILSVCRQNILHQELP